jgi:hypothetical protein
LDYCFDSVEPFPFFRAAFRDGDWLQVFQLFGYWGDLDLDICLGVEGGGCQDQGDYGFQHAYWSL